MFAFVYRAGGGLNPRELEERIRAVAPVACRVTACRRFAILRDSGTLEAGDGVSLALGEGNRDTARLIADFARRGETALGPAEGRFALLRWDGNEPRVLLAADPLGAGRLYYAVLPDGFLVATRLPLLLALPGAPSRPDLESLALLITGDTRPLERRTAWAGVRLVAGGTCVDLGHTSGCHEWRWWQPEDAPEVRYARPSDYTAELRELFGEAVRSALPPAGERVGIAMSGGLDSTLVAGYAAAELARNNRLLHAWTSVPQMGLETAERPDIDNDDWPWAALVAGQHPNILHQPVTPDGTCPLDVLDEVIAVSRTPVRNTANHIWLLKLARRAREAGVHVLLNGIHGNASISFEGRGGLERLLAEGRWVLLARHLERLPQGAWSTLARTIAGTLCRPATLARLRGRDAARRLRHPQLFSEWTRRLAERLIPAETSRAGERRRFLLAPQHGFEADWAAHEGIEMRDPTGDRRLCEYVLRCPPEAFVGDGFDRLQARLLGAGVVPDAVRWRRSRGIQSPEVASHFPLYAERYREAWARIERLPEMAELVNLEEAGAALERLIAGEAVPGPARVLNRVISAGLFLEACARPAAMPAIGQHA